MQQAKTHAYILLVRPHLETCAPIWLPHLKESSEEGCEMDLWCQMGQKMDATSRGLLLKARPTND